MDNHYTISEEEINQITRTNTININIGVLGHIDSGKTSLARVLSKVTSTASLDKNPQSQERGITLDLGFSAFYTRIPEKKKTGFSNAQYFQFTLVDCPGHASLIRTIIGGAQIIDLMILVIDINKGVQTQTAECLVIGEILANKLIVVLNKIDMIPIENRQEIIKKKVEGLQKVFSKTKFSANIPIVCISSLAQQPLNINEFISVLVDSIEPIDRQNEKNKGLLFLIDHCFALKGQGKQLFLSLEGTVTTGTILQGQIKLGDDVYFPSLNVSKKVKSMQMFKKSVDMAGPGDRVATLYAGLDPKEVMYLEILVNQIERSIVCQPGVVQPMENIILPIQKIAYYKGSIKSQNKFHITSGHQTIMGQLKLFLRPKNVPFQKNMEGEFLEDYEMFEKLKDKQSLFGLVQLEKPMLASFDSLVIASKLDSDLEANICRIAFYGTIINAYSNKEIFKENNLRIFRKKTKQGKTEKIIDNYTLLIKDLFKKETNINLFLGKLVIFSGLNFQGKIDSAFGKSGKVRVIVDKDLTQEEDQQKILDSSAIMIYKKYLFEK